MTRGATRSPTSRSARAGIPIVSRSSGVLVQLPEPGATGHGRSDRRPGAGHHPRRPEDADRLQQGRLPRSAATRPTRSLGAAPVGTGSGVVDSPAGNDTILGRGGDDSLVGGDRGPGRRRRGKRQLVGGRSTAAGPPTVIHGDPATTRSSPGSATTRSSVTPAATPSPTPPSSSRGSTSSTAARTGSSPSSRTGARPPTAAGSAGPNRTSSIPTSAPSSAATATTSSSATTSPTRSSVSLPRAPPA